MQGTGVGIFTSRVCVCVSKTSPPLAGQDVAAAAALLLGTGIGFCPAWQ